MDTEKQNVTSEHVYSERKITLSPKMFKFAIISLVTGSIMFIAAGGYSIYSLLNYKKNQASINEMQQSTELQQEQLLNLSKKATFLNEELQNLTQMESELRIQAGIKPAKDVEKKAAENEAASGESGNNTEESVQSNSNDDSGNNTESTTTEEPSGQGGPIGDLSLNDVDEALKILEADLKTRRESLEELQDELKKQREQMAIIVSIQSAAQNNMANVAGSTVTTPVSQNAFAFGTASVSSSVPAIWQTTGVVTSPYGLRWGGSDFHPGIDIANDMGTPIVATADGIVEYAGWNSGGYGNMVDINHGNGIMTRYGHASQVVVSTGQYVKRGQIIALMGSTGFSTGPHVHYEVHVNGQRVNPISYL